MKAVFFSFVVFFHFFFFFISTPPLFFSACPVHMMSLYIKGQCTIYNFIILFVYHVKYFAVLKWVDSSFLEKA